MVSRLEGDLETERDRIHQQRQREEELRVKVLSQEGQLTNKQQEAERLERMLEVVKQEASAQMHDRVCVHCTSELRLFGRIVVDDGFFFFFVLCRPNGIFSLADGKFGSLSPRRVLY